MRALQRSGWFAALATFVLACALSAIAAASALAQAPGVGFAPTLKLAVGQPLEGFGGRAAELDGRLRFEVPEGQEPPVVTGGRILLPKGIAIDGRRYAKCSGRLMRESRSVDVCPKASIVGYGPAPAFEPPSGFTSAHTVFLNGGARRIWAFTTIYNPALVQEPISFELRRVGGRRWSYEVAFEIPSSMRLVAGVPIALTHVPLRIGGYSYGLGYVTFQGRCPARGSLSFEASLTYVDRGVAGEARRRGRVSCRSARLGEDGK